MATLLAVTVFALQCLTSFTSAAQVSFTATPTTIKHMLTPEMTMMCSVNPDLAIRMPSLYTSDKSSQHRTSTTFDIQHVSSVIIAREGADIAVVSEHSPVSSFDNITGLQVTGEASGNGTGFLQVNWTFPGPDQAGTYQCRISGLDAIGHPVSLTQSLVINQDEISMGDMVKHVNNLQRIIDVQNTTIGDLASMNSKQQSTIDAQQTAISNLLSMNAQIEKKLNTVVMFTAALSADATVPNNGILVFDRLVTSVGGGFDTNTGIFTCPVAGYYVFHMHIMTWHQYADFDIVLNGQKLVALEIDGQGDSNQSGSNMVYIKLKQGDTVWLISYGTSHPHGNSVPHTTFNGQLLTLV